MKPSDYYLNLAAPLVDMDVSRDGKVPRNRPGEALASGPTNDLQRWWGQQAQKHRAGSRLPRADWPRPRPGRCRTVT